MNARAEAAADGRTTPSGITVTYALLGGILYWLAHLIGMAASTGRACATGQLWPYHLITVVTAGLTLHALWVSRRLARPAASTPGFEAARFLGWTATALNVASAVLIVAEWTRVLVLDPCLAG